MCIWVAGEAREVESYEIKENIAAIHVIRK